MQGYGNKQRNEHAIKLGENTYVCKTSLKNLAKLEEHFDASIFEIYQLFESGKLRLNQIIDIVNITSINEINQQQLEDDIEETGVVFALGNLSPLIATAYIGRKKDTAAKEVVDTDKKSE